MAIIFRVLWDTDHASGVLPGEFETEEEADEFGLNWQREMCLIDGDDPDDEFCPYQYEVIMEDTHDEDDAEEAAAAEEQSLDYFNRYIAGDR